MKFVQVCGYQRSGTSFVSKLLNTHPDIYISGELPRNMYGPTVLLLKKLDEDFDRIGGGERKNWLSKKKRFNLELFLSTSKYVESFQSAENATVFGNKTPRSERYYKSLLGAMHDLCPVFVYCLRDPVKTLESKLNMFRTNRNFAYSLRDYEQSIRDLLQMREEIPDRLHVFSVEKYNKTREAELYRLLNFVDVKCSGDIVDVLAAVPPRNTTSDQLKSRARHEGVVFDKKHLDGEMMKAIEDSDLCNIAKDILENPW